MLTKEVENTLRVELTKIEFIKRASYDPIYSTSYFPRDLDIQAIVISLKLDDFLFEEADKDFIYGKRSKFVLKEESDKSVDSFEDVIFVTNDNMDIECFRATQKQTLHKVKSSIDSSDDNNTRIIGGINTSHVPVVVTRTKRFRRETQEYIVENSKNKRSVYNLNSNFFQLSS